MRVGWIVVIFGPPLAYSLWLWLGPRKKYEETITREHSHVRILRRNDED